MSGNAAILNGMLFCASRLSSTGRCASRSWSLTTTFAFSAPWRSNSLRICRSSQVAVKAELTEPFVVVGDCPKIFSTFAAVSESASAFRSWSTVACDTLVPFTR